MYSDIAHQEPLKSSVFLASSDVDIFLCELICTNYLAITDEEQLKSLKCISFTTRSSKD